MLQAILAGASLVFASPSPEPATDAMFSDVGVSQGDIFQPSFATLGEQTLATIEIDGQPAILVLDPFNMRVPGARVLLDDGTGDLFDAGHFPSHTFRGRIMDVVGSHVAATVVDGTIRGIVILPDGQMHGFQPAVHGMAGEHVSYAVSDVKQTDGHCGNSDDELGHDHGGELSGDPEGFCNLATLIATDSDFEYYQLNGSDVQATVDDVESIINGMDLIYTMDTRVTYFIGDHIIRTDVNDPYTSSDPFTLRGQFQAEWNNNQQAIDRDIAHLFTGRDINGGVIGIAFFNGVCSSTDGYALSQSRFTNNFTTRVGLTAHELGHNWNAMHCNADPDCFIMCSGINGCRGDVTLFGSSSIATIINYANNIATCLEGTNDAPNVPPRARDDVGGSVDGQVAFLDVLENDEEGNCQDLSIGSFDTSSALGGTIELSVGTGPDGRDELKYTPPNGVGVDTDTFSYEASDPDGNTSSATVTIILTVWIEPVYDGPTEPRVNVAYYDLSDVGTLRFVPDFDLLTPIGEETVPMINFAETGGTFAGSGLSDEVGARFEGVLIVPEEDVYTLFTESTDGCNLYIEGELIIDNDGLHNMREREATFGLREGLYRFRLDYFENRQTAGLILRWRSNGISKRPIPASALAHAVGCPADLDGDGDADADDFFAFLDAFATGDQDVCDVDGDNDCDADDFFGYLDLFAQSC